MSSDNVPLPHSLLPHLFPLISKASTGNSPRGKFNRCVFFISCLWMTKSAWFGPSLQQSTNNQILGVPWDKVISDVCMDFKEYPRRVNLNSPTDERSYPTAAARTVCISSSRSTAICGTVGLSGSAWSR